jgi:hypothetical protein
MAFSPEEYERFSAEPPPPPPPRRRSTWVWVIVLGVGLFAAPPLCCCGGIFWFSFSALANSEPYRMAFEQLSQDREVQDRLGRPIRRRGLVSGSLDARNGRGNARLQFTITGPKGEADVETKAVRVGGRWIQRELRIRYPDGEQVIVVRGGERVEVLPEAPEE